MDPDYKRAQDPVLTPNQAVPPDPAHSPAPDLKERVGEIAGRGGRSTGPSLPDARSGWLRRDFFGADSIQGLLELAEWYPRGGVTLGGTASALNDPYHPLGRLKQLESEGLLGTTWIERPSSDGHPYLMLDKIWLTTKGHEKLRALRELNPHRRWLSRASSIGWAAITSVITTLLTLQVRSCGP